MTIHSVQSDLHYNFNNECTEESGKDFELGPYKTCLCVRRRIKINCNVFSAGYPPLTRRNH
ncbi:hypothetical protein B0H17DRAFT_1063066 [Mycena rosella]|uniref:Uncharacterized protein n=1 Tax=Mycena rosella TaxID=1033263 RepID=A0AAD7DJF6_MYCRO|nr:hypothetical protein B0H17DRAFT_1063066 [Mycena rosella]